MSGNPVLICLDLQRVFQRPGALLAPHSPEVLVECRRLLQLARQHRWDIVHCLLKGGASPFFFSAEDARPVDGMEPKSRERVLERQSLSAYGHPAFQGVMDLGRCRGVVIIGLSASITVAATTFDAFEHGHPFILAANGIAGQAGAEANARAHEAVTRDVAEHLGFRAASAFGGAEAVLMQPTWRR